MGSRDRGGLQLPLAGMEKAGGWDPAVGGTSTGAEECVVWSRTAAVNGGRWKRRVTRVLEESRVTERARVAILF